MKTFFITLICVFALSFTADAQTQSFRCGAMTTKNEPCKLKVKFAGAKCHHHGGITNDGQSETVNRCGAPTSKGTPCKNKVRFVGAKCHHHS